MFAQADRIAKRSQQACTTCRQVKLRCDGKETFPQACSRCKKNNLECRTDATFKRVRTRHRLDEVTSQLNAIQKTLGIRVANLGSGFQTTHSTPSTGASATLSSPQPVSSGTREDAIEDSTSRSEILEFYEFPLPDSPISIGPVMVKNEQVKELLIHFRDHYYTQCPILNTDMSIAELYGSSPFLFWTIITISSRWHPYLSYMYELIVEEYRLKLGFLLSGPILELDSVQAIVLLCFWPLSVTKQIYDPSWNYCGLVTNAALKMGLQHIAEEKVATPGGQLLRVRESRAKTWMACVQVNAMHAWSYGLSMSAEITSGAKPFLTPLSTVDFKFKAKTALQQQSAKFAFLMATVKDTADSLQFTQILIQDLETVKDRYSEIWSSDIDIILLSVQLKIYAFQLQAQNQRQKDVSSPKRDFNLGVTSKALQNLGFTVAIRLIHTFSELFDNSWTASSGPSYSQDRDNSILYRYLPKQYFHALLFAVSFVFRLLAIRASELPTAESDLARNHIQITYRIVSSQSLAANDELARAAKMIEVLSRAHNLSRLKTDEMTPGPGSGLHLLEDTIRVAKEIREGNTQTSETVGNSAENADAPLDIPETDESTVPHLQQDLLDLSDASQFEYSFDFGQYFDWNTIPGFDLAMPLFVDSVVDNSI